METRQREITIKRSWRDKLGRLNIHINRQIALLNVCFNYCFACTNPINNGCDRSCLHDFFFFLCLSFNLRKLNWIALKSASAIIIPESVLYTKCKHFKIANISLCTTSVAGTLARACLNRIIFKLWLSLIFIWFALSFSANATFTEFSRYTHTYAKCYMTCLFFLTQQHRERVESIKDLSNVCNLIGK